MSEVQEHQEVGRSGGDPGEAARAVIMSAAQVNSARLNVVECDAFEQATVKAYSDSMSTMGDAIPVVMFQQGSRIQLSGALPYSVVSRVVIARSADKRDTIEQAMTAANRPKDPVHVKDIAAYVKENRDGKYILGALTLNIAETMNLYTVKSASTFRAGYLVIPRTAKISITDGQHRQGAIAALLSDSTLSGDDIQALGSQAIAVVITNESEVGQMHQDFADASKTKPLPPGLLAVYDRRNPANRIVLVLEEKCPLLMGRVDAASKSLSKRSSSLYTANQVRQFVKVFLIGNWQMGSSAFEHEAQNMLHDPKTFDKELAKVVDFLNYMTTKLPVWKEIAELERGLASTKVVDLRKKGYVCLTATGLVIIARIAHELFKNIDRLTQEGKDWTFYANKLAALDWTKAGPIWMSNIVQPDAKGNMKVLQQQNLIRQAIDAVRKEIGLPDYRRH